MNAVIIHGSSVWNQNRQAIESLDCSPGNLLAKWFYVHPGYLPATPHLCSLPQGIELNGRLIRSILVTSNLYEMIKTDADAIWTDFHIFPGKPHILKILSSVKKPVIVRIANRWSTTATLTETLKVLADNGTAGLYVDTNCPTPKLLTICTNSSIPVLAGSSPELSVIAPKFDAGISAVCVAGKTISLGQINSIREKYPRLPVIACCHRSVQVINHSIHSGAGAVAFKPCIVYRDKLWAEDF